MTFLFALAAILLVCAAFAIGVRFGYRDGYEVGRRDAITDGWDEEDA